MEVIVHFTLVDLAGGNAGVFANLRDLLLAVDDTATIDELRVLLVFLCHLLVHVRQRDLDVELHIVFIIANVVVVVVLAPDGAVLPGMAGRRMRQDLLGFAYFGLQAVQGVFEFVVHFGVPGVVLIAVVHYASTIVHMHIIAGVVVNIAVDGDAHGTQCRVSFHSETLIDIFDAIGVGVVVESTAQDYQIKKLGRRAKTVTVRLFFVGGPLLGPHLGTLYGLFYYNIWVRR